MATKKDLEARIEALEAEIAQLRLQVAQKQPGITIAPPYVPYPNYWYRPYQVWCSTSTSPSLKNTFAIN